MNNLDEQINRVNSRIIELEMKLEKTENKTQIKRLEELIKTNKEVLLVLDHGQENYRLEN